MTDRRRFLTTLALAPLAARLSPALAAEAARGVVLAIGNDAYRQAPLVNPARDARAMGRLFGEAGFDVALHTDANLPTMAAAIERFGAAIRRSETKLAVFYYAGHGAQVDWRNFLLPVDAAVRSAADLKSQCVDLGLLLQQFAGLRDKTFVVILDACRDNPFGSGYRTESKGLSQFDAPVGSLIAYATAPGQVALDGEGENGLYTSNLVREFSVRGARIEDCLKRVRLNVRLASQGMQIPWESTSLEGDVFIFPTAPAKLTEEELERQFEDELAAWNAVKASRKIDDWAAYLKTYPNGRFSEVAQARLARLLAAVERRTAAAPATPALELGAGLPARPLFTPPDNPNSAGTHALGRKFSVGDEAVYRRSDQLTGVVEGVHKSLVTRVDADNDWVDINDGKAATDLLGNPIKNPQRVFDGPMQFFPAELQLGKKWVARMTATRRGGKRQDVELDVKIAALEKVAVPAGEFHAFRIEASGWNSSGGQLERRFWVVPGLNFAVRIERTTRKHGRLVETERDELVSLRQAG